ncbi:hypothetical protein Tco_1411008, partial [Tanacetum coccineum]
PVSCQMHNNIMAAGSKERPPMLGPGRYSHSTNTPLEQVQHHDDNDVFANVRQHSEQPESINDTYVLEKDDGNVIPDSSNICTNDTKCNKMGYSALTARDLDTMPGNAGSQSGLKTTRITRRRSWQTLVK